MNAAEWHLAELNVARLRHPLDHPDTAEFVAALDDDQRPGGVVARASCGGSPTSRGLSSSYVRADDDPLVIINLSVWESPDHLHDFVFHTAHTPFLRRRREWFERMAEAFLVCWWVPAGHVPTVEESLDRLDRLRREGVSDDAFTLRDRRPPAGSVVGRMERFGLVGLPNAGKSSLYNALTGGGALAAPYAFATKDPNIGVAKVPDERLDRLAEMSKSRNVVHAAVQVVDIGGLVEGASKGEGLGNKFLANIREVDAVVFVLRAFEDDDVTGPVGSDRAPPGRRAGAGAGRPGDGREAPPPGPAAIEAGQVARRRGRRAAGRLRRAVGGPPAVPRRAEARRAGACWRRTSC